MMSPSRFVGCQRTGLVQRTAVVALGKLFVLFLLVRCTAVSFGNEYATIDLSKAYRHYTVTNQTGFTIDTGDTVVVSSDIRYTHNGLGEPAAFNWGTFGLAVFNGNTWWTGVRDDIAVASRGGAIGTRLPAAPWIEGWLSHASLGVDFEANLDDQGEPIAEDQRVPQVSDWLRQEWTLTVNGSGFVEGVATITSLEDSSVTFTTTPYELGKLNGGAGYSSGATLYGGYNTGWDSGLDHDNDPLTDNQVVAKELITNFSRSDVDNFSVVKNGVAVFSDDFSSYEPDSVIGGAVDTGLAWNPKWSIIDPDGVPDSGDEDTSQQDLFVSFGTPVVGGLACDFNADDACDLTDMDLLYQNFGGDLSYDVNGDDTVDSGDIPDWLTAASDPENTYLGGEKTFRNGDTNLDGEVNSADLGLLLNNFGNTSGLTYGEGNLNGDLNVDSSDLGQLLNSFGFASSAAAASAVPEPNALALLMGSLIGLAGFRRRRRR